MKRILETIFVTMENVCSVTQDNSNDIAYIKKQAIDNKDNITGLNNRLWIIIIGISVLIALVAPE